MTAVTHTPTKEDETMQQPPQGALDWAALDARVVEIKCYPDGWIPKADPGPVRGRCLVYRRNDEDQWELHRIDKVNRKRSNGAGSDWVSRIRPTVGPTPIRP